MILEISVGVSSTLLKIGKKNCPGIHREAGNDYILLDHSLIIMSNGLREQRAGRQGGDITI